MLLHIPADFFADLGVLGHRPGQQGIESLHVLSHSCGKTQSTEITRNIPRAATAPGCTSHLQEAQPRAEEVLQPQSFYLRRAATAAPAPAQELLPASLCFPSPPQLPQSVPCQLCTAAGTALPLLWASPLAEASPHMPGRWHTVSRRSTAFSSRSTSPSMSAAVHDLHGQNTITSILRCH